MKTLLETIEKALNLQDGNEAKIDMINEIRDFIHKLSPIDQPIDFVRWVPIEMVEPNDYNPNSVAKKEMQLLYTSIKQDGYTQPIVTIYDPKKQKYIIVDGFHRYFTAHTQANILERNHGRVPVTVIDKSINERMAATVRHNRARGEHSVNGMGNMVYEMLKNGATDADICNQLGLEVEELIKLKHLTGFSKLFDGVEYGLAWETPLAIRVKHEYYEKQKNGTAESGK